MIPKRIELYKFDKRFEAAVVTLACCRPRFYGRVAYVLDPELLKADEAKLALRAAHAINKDVGHGPSSLVLVIQRLRRWMADGKCTIEKIRAVSDMFDVVEDAGLPDEEEVVAELAPVLAQRIRDEAVQVGIDSFSKKGDLSKVIELETKAARIGQVDTSVGTILGPESFKEMTKLRNLQRLKTGVWDLDSNLGGGLQCGGLGIALGGSGDGKSMFLSHVTGQNLTDAVHVGYATLELPVPIVLARIKANITEVPIDALLAGDTLLAEERITSYGTKIGGLVVQEFAPQVTTVDDLKEWADQCAQQRGRRFDLLVVDYADKLVAKSKKGEKDANEYKTGQVVFEGLRHWANDEKFFCWTAAQATRRKDKKKKLDLNDVADSMHKIRVADLVITLNLEEDETGEGEDPRLSIYCAKHRTGKSRFNCGPYTTEYAVGRVCPIIED